METQLPTKPTAFELSEVMSSLASVEACDITISKALDVSRGAVNHWRHGRNTISRSHWLDLCVFCQTLTHSDLAAAVIASVSTQKPFECTETRKKAAVGGVVTRLIGPGVLADAIADQACAECEGELAACKFACNKCIDQLQAERIAEAQQVALKWDDLFDQEDVPEEAPEEESLAMQAHRIVNERNEEVERMYGPFSEGMERAAMIFTGSTGIKVEGRHMYHALVALKLSRQSYNHKDDNLLDAMAYLQGLANLENGKA